MNTINFSITTGGNSLNGGSEVQDVWHYVGEQGEPQFKNSAMNYGGTWGHLRFKKLDNGIVVIDGLIKNVKKYKVIFTLPQGYRPEQKLIFIVSIGDTNTGRVDIDTRGNVVSRATKSTYLSLSGVSFVAK